VLAGSIIDAMNMTKLIAEMKQHYAGNPEPPRMGAGNKPALLIVDFIEGFTNKSSPLAGDWDEQINNTIVLLQAVRQKGLPVIFTTVEYNPGELKANLLSIKSPRIEILIKDSRWIAIDQRLATLEEDIIISKKYGSAFFETRLAEQLQVLNIDTLLISGCVTSGCVRASAVDAAQSGFRPIVVRETVADRSLLANEANLIDIEQRYGDVISLEEASQYIQSI
jgi:maleamate amidohydrolase